MKITRDKIINYFTDKIKNNSFVYAFWLEGSDATSTSDEYSDLDLWLDVKDGKEETINNLAKEIFSQVGEIDFIHKMPKPHAKIWHTIFHLKGTPPTLLIDFCVQSHSRKFVFTKELPDHKIKILFNKNNTIRFKHLDKTMQAVAVKNRIEELKKTYDFFLKSYISKNILRNNFIESIYYYQRYALEPLIEVLRIKHCPLKKDYGFKHISKDLPKSIQQQIETLYKVGNIKDIEHGIQKAKELFYCTIKEIEK